ncbi:MAG TPA: DUF5110 domain-containing protein, partial [Pseudoduganella sp.]
RIPLRYDDKSGTVTIGNREGQYQGMVARRTFRVHFIKPGVSTSGSMDVADKEVTYEGKEVTIKR